MSPPAQNIYDNDAFFAGYGKLRRSVEGLGGAPEWPTLRAMLPAMARLRVVDLGCGFGWFCRFAREAGASHVLGLDLSEKMLARAREASSDGAIVYRRADLEHLDMPPAAFDLAYSSLALHYIANLKGLLETVHRALVPGGRLVFSVEHPLYTAPTTPDWSADDRGHKRWLLDRYLDEGERSTNWLAEGVIKQHRTIASYVNLLLELGFTMCRLEEWGPSEAEIANHPEWAVERDRPPFLLVSAAR
ncbi:MAG: class I SAM-dependent methyltransferase [Alphaproteobacteria bacterium]|nr:class I SAM-dependent methyltransferase [Alphaproteobacteria bacterium]MBV8412560.1 class I SAM-dependent methyltransferase [Alphaproteobacteria bacterium]